MSCIMCNKEIPRFLYFLSVYVEPENLYEEFHTPTIRLVCGHEVQYGSHVTSVE